MKKLLDVVVMLLILGAGLTAGYKSYPTINRDIDTAAAANETADNSTYTEVSVPAINETGIYHLVLAGTILEGPSLISGLNSFEYQKLLVKYGDNMAYVIFKAHAHPDDYGSIYSPGTRVEFQQIRIPAIETAAGVNVFLLIR